MMTDLLAAFTQFIFQEEQPSLSITEVSKTIGERWKTVSAEDKKMYEEKAAEDKQRYIREMEAFKAAGGQVATPKGEFIQ